MQGSSGNVYGYISGLNGNTKGRKVHSRFWLFLTTSTALMMIIMIMMPQFPFGHEPVQFAESQKERMLFVGWHFLDESQRTGAPWICPHNVENVVDLALDDLAYIDVGGTDVVHQEDILVGCARY